MALTKEIEASIDNIDSLFLTLNIQQKQAVTELKCQNGVRYFRFSHKIDFRDLGWMDLRTISNI